MATTPKKWQSTLNVVGSIVTVVTAPSTGSQISSINIMNTNTTTDRTVSIYVGGTGASASNLWGVITVKANTNTLIAMPNSPIVLENAETLRMCQDTGSDVTATLCGLNM